MCWKYMMGGCFFALIVMTSCGPEKAGQQAFVNHKDHAVNNEEEKGSAIDPVEIVSPRPSVAEVPLVSPVAVDVPPPPAFGPLPLPFLNPLVAPIARTERDYHEEDEEECGSGQYCDFANTSFSSGDGMGYVIETHSYPITTALALNRNAGTKKGGITLTPTGLTVQSPGDYWVSISAILVYEDESPDPNYTPLIPIFLMRNGDSDPANADLGSAVSLPANIIVNFQASGVVRDIEKHTPLTILATNGGSPNPQPVNVLAWSISLHKICESHHKSKL